MPGFDTAATIISDVAKELGIARAAISDPFAATDDLVIQLTAMLKPTGRELAKLHAWQHLQREATFNTINVTASYDLATDFGRIIDDTEWNRTQSMSAPVANPQQWARLKATTNAGAHKILRIKGDLIFVDPTPTGAETFAYEYVSRNWGAASFAKEAPTAAADAIQFDPHLFTRALKLRWRTEKGFDNTAALGDFATAFRLATGQDGAAAAVTIGGGRGMASPNVPETGFGA